MTTLKLLLVGLNHVAWKVGDIGVALRGNHEDEP